MTGRNMAIETEFCRVFGFPLATEVGDGLVIAIRQHRALEQQLEEALRERDRARAELENIISG